MGLTLEERLSVLGEGHYIAENIMLTDSHITEFIKILQSHTSFEMQSPLFLQLPFNIKPVQLNKKYLQILFSGNNKHGHWICIYYNDYVIHVYDSINQHSLHADHEKYLRHLFPNIDNLKIVFENVENQDNPYDYGIFAIAFVISIINDICPCNLKFSQSEMRKHLLNLFDNFTLEMFPILYNSSYENNSSETSGLTHHEMLNLTPISFTTSKNKIFKPTEFHNKQNNHEPKSNLNRKEHKKNIKKESLVILTDIATNVESTHHNNKKYIKNDDYIEKIDNKIENNVKNFEMKLKNLKGQKEDDEIKKAKTTTVNRSIKNNKKLNDILLEVDKLNMEEISTNTKIATAQSVNHTNKCFEKMENNNNKKENENSNKTIETENYIHINNDNNNECLNELKKQKNKRRREKYASYDLDLKIKHSERMKLYYKKQKLKNIEDEKSEKIMIKENVKINRDIINKKRRENYATNNLQIKIKTCERMKHKYEKKKIRK